MMQPDKLPVIVAIDVPYVEPLHHPPGPQVHPDLLVALLVVGLVVVGLEDLAGGVHLDEVYVKPSFF